MFVADFLVRGLMKKHDDHVRVLEALIYNQETIVNLKDAKIEELEDCKQQLQFHVTKLQDNQIYFDVRPLKILQKKTVACTFCKTFLAPLTYFEDRMWLEKVEYSRKSFILHVDTA